MERPASRRLPPVVSSAFRVRCIGAEFPVVVFSVPPAILRKKLGFRTSPQFLLQSLPNIAVHQFDCLFIMNGHTVLILNHHGAPFPRPANDGADSIVSLLSLQHGGRQAFYKGKTALSLVAPMPTYFLTQKQRALQDKYRFISINHPKKLSFNLTSRFGFHMFPKCRRYSCILPQRRSCRCLKFSWSC